MRNHLLLLLIGLVCVFGGCSRCKDAPRPNMPFGISIYQNVDSYFIGDSLVMGQNRDTATQPFAEDDTHGTTFEATDSTWDEYVWTFAQSYRIGGPATGRRISVSAGPRIDTAILKAYRNQRRDSMTARKAFRVVSFRDLGLGGTYRGALKYGDSFFPDVQINLLPVYEIFWLPCGGWRPGYLIDGIFKPCGGLDLKIPISNFYSRKSFEIGPNVAYGISDTALRTYPSCGFGDRSGYCNVGTYSYSGRSIARGTLRGDTLILAIPSFRFQRDLPTDSYYIPIHFKGVRQ